MRSTLSQSVLSGNTCVQHDMLRTRRELTDTQLGADYDLGLSLHTTDTCIVHKQTKDCATTKTDLTDGRKNNKDAATRQQAGRNNLANVGR